VAAVVVSCGTADTPSNASQASSTTTSATTFASDDAERCVRILEDGGKIDDCQEGASADRTTSKGSRVSNEMRAALIEYLDALEAIGAAHEELFDTDVRERLAATIEQVFVLRQGPLAVPIDLGMFSTDANEALSSATAAYLATAAIRARALGLDEAARRAAVWDAEATSSAGTPVDEFLGWPE
jgi:hypothetical protein